MKKKKKKKGAKKRIHWFFWLCFAILFLLLISQVKNERYAAQCYNRGNRYYREGSYSLAETEYRIALNGAEDLILHRECDIRCNLALAIVAPLTPDSVTDENRDDVLSELTKAKYILTVSGCAHDYDNLGHDADCQTLKNEIDAYMELLDPPEEPEEEEPEEEAGGSADAQEKESKEQEVRRELEQIQKDGMADRKDDLDTADHLSHFEFYYGARW